MSEQDWGSPAPAYDALAHLQTTVTALHQSIEPAAIRSNLLEVFIAVNHALYGGEWWHDLGLEYQAWEAMDAHADHAEWYTAARDSLATIAYELCSEAHGWLSGPEQDWQAARDAAVGKLVWVSATARGG
jgi:hypothetical protein